MISGQAEQVIMTGGPSGRRAQIFNDYIVAIEDRRLWGPRIRQAWEDHRAVTRLDLFGRGHPPDSFVAGALAWACHRRMQRYDLDLGVERLSSPGPLVGLR